MKTRKNLRTLSLVVSITLILSCEGGMISIVEPVDQSIDEPTGAQMHEVLRESGNSSVFVFEVTFGKAKLFSMGDFNRVELDGAPSFFQAVGAPVLPKRTYTIVIPLGHHLKSVSFEPVKTQTFLTDQPIEAMSAPQPLCIDCDVNIPDPGPTDLFYKRNNAFPGSNIQSRPLQYMHGYAIAFVDFYPLRYFPLSQRLTQVLRGRIRVETERDVVLPLDASPRPQPQAQEQGQKALLSFVDDAGFIFTYQSSLQTYSIQPLGETY